MTDISLITSLYQSDTFLPAYADHIIALAQSATQHGITLEVIIIPNDASDTERGILTQLQNTLTQRQLATMQVHYVQRETLYASWNRGFSHANGKALGVLNVDDQRTLDGLIAGKTLILEKDCDLVDFAYYKVTDNTQQLNPAQFDASTLSLKATLSPFWMCHQRLFHSVGDFNPNFRILGDYEWAKRPQVRQSNAITSDVIAGEFRLHGENLSATKNPLEAVEANIVLIWQGAFAQVRPVDPDLMREVWHDWGHYGATLPDETADFLWGDGARERYQRYQWERNLPAPIRRVFLALAKRGLVNSVDWDLHHD